VPPNNSLELTPSVGALEWGETPVEIRSRVLDHHGSAAQLPAVRPLMRCSSVLDEPTETKGGSLLGQRGVR